MAAESSAAEAQLGLPSGTRYGSAITPRSALCPHRSCRILRLAGVVQVGLQQFRSDGHCLLQCPSLLQTDLHLFGAHLFWAAPPFFLLLEKRVLERPFSSLCYPSSWAPCMMDPPDGERPGGQPLYRRRSWPAQHSLLPSALRHCSTEACLQ